MLQLVGLGVHLQNKFGLFSLFFYASNMTPTVCSHIGSPFTIKAQKMVLAYDISDTLATHASLLVLLGPSGSAHGHVFASFKCQFVTGRMRSSVQNH